MLFFLRFLLCLLPSLALAATEAPYFQVHGADHGVLPLQSTDVHASIGLGFAEVRVLQTYRNEGKQEIDATYLFPAGEEAAVHGVTMTVGGRRVEAVVKEKEEARRTFEAAKASGKTAALLEAHRPNLFSMNLTRIRPGDTVTVELRYVERIVVDRGEFSWAFPTTIGPRYSGGGGSAEGVPAGGSNVSGPEPDFSVTAEILAGFAVRKLSSPSHRVESAIQKDGAVVRLAAGEGPQMNRDFIIRYTLEGDATRPRLLIQEWQGQRYVAVNWMPPRRGPRARTSLTREFVFVVDVSGSMSGFPLDTARLLMGELLQDLRDGDAFNILLFSGSQLQLSDRPLPATPENIARGVAFVQAGRGGGGTELIGALEAAFAVPRSSNSARTLVVVTDGYVTVEPEAYALVSGKIGDAALFPFGIGSSVNRDLIARLARAGRTRPAIVENEARAIELSAEFRARIDSPVLTSTRMEWKGAGALHPLPITAPAYADLPWSFVARLEGPAEGVLTFSGMKDEGPFREELSLKDVEHLPEGPLLAQIWARDQLERLGDLLALGVEVPRVKKAIIALGLGYNLLTPFTSFVVVDTVTVPGPTPQGVTQPNALPAGMNMTAMGESVPGAPEPGTWAMLLVSTGFLGRWWLRRRRGQ